MAERDREVTTPEDVERREKLMDDFYETHSYDEEPKDAVKETQADAEDEDDD